MIIDDLIKTYEEANNEAVKEKHWEWFTNTMLSRLEEGGKIIIIMTRWASDDLAGKALEYYKDTGIKIRHISMKALIDKETHEMLCSEILSYESYQEKIRAMGADVASANYDQEPMDIKGRLYSSFKTYEQLPMDQRGNLLFTAIKCYCDTADEGDDYLCNIIYGVYNKEAYALDIYYTKDPMEITEIETARRIFDNGVSWADIESNNGGRAFARNVRRILKEKFGWIKTHVHWFHQSKNKIARILSHSTWVMDHFYLPVNWRDRWPEYHNAMIKFLRDGENKHDDAPDATTGVAENADKTGMSVLK
jgi:predicted phage terminase large subunit-like protein